MKTTTGPGGQSEARRERKASAPRPERSGRRVGLAEHVQAPPPQRNVEQAQARPLVLEVVREARRHARPRPRLQRARSSSASLNSFCRSFSLMVVNRSLRASSVSRGPASSAASQDRQPLGVAQTLLATRGHRASSSRVSLCAASAQGVGLRPHGTPDRGSAPA